MTPGDCSVPSPRLGMSCRALLPNLGAVSTSLTKALVWQCDVRCAVCILASHLKSILPWWLTQDGGQWCSMSTAVPWLALKGCMETSTKESMPTSYLCKTYLNILGMHLNQAKCFPLWKRNEASNSSCSVWCWCAGIHGWVEHWHKMALKSLSVVVLEYIPKRSTLSPTPRISLPSPHACRWLPWLWLLWQTRAACKRKRTMDRINVALYDQTMVNSFK